MIVLRLVEFRQRLQRGHDRRGEQLVPLDLLDIGLGYRLLRVVAVEDRRAVLRALVVALPVELRRIVGDGEEQLEDLAVAEAARVVGDLILEPFLSIKIYSCSKVT